MADFPIWNYPMQAAQLAVREGIPADVALATIEALGGDVNPAQFYKLYGQAESARALVNPTAELPPDQQPPPDLIQPRETVTSEGYEYQMSVSAVNLDTGEDIEIPYSIVTPDLIDVGEAIESAIVSQTLRAPDYQLDILGARLTGVYDLQPRSKKAAA